MDLATTLLHVNRFALPALGLLVVAACVVWLVRGARHSPPQAWLLNTINHDKLPLARYENSIGRSKHCDVVLNYPAVSRLHAVIVHRRQGWVIIDTGSRGGTKLNGKPLERRMFLKHGQVIAFGEFEFMFYIAEESQKNDRDHKIPKRPDAGDGRNARGT